MASTSLTFDIYAKDHASSTFDKFGKSVSDSEKHTSSLGNGLKTLATAFAGLAVIQKVTQFMGDSIAEARESQKVNALTAAAIKSTGGAANVTADQISDLANSISLKAGIDDEAIQSGENLLLTFTNIRNEVGKGNDIFNQATQTATDMSAALGQDMKSSVMQLGKALNDPVKGITALTRVGVAFTDQQKAQITALTDSGHQMQAQKIILGELNKEFGGAAASQATAGDKAKVAWENLQETIGTKLLPILDALEIWFVAKGLPALSKFGSFLQANVVPAVIAVGAALLGMVGPTKAVFGFIVDNIGPIGAFAAVLGTYAAVALTVAAGLKVWAIAQGILNVVMSANPIAIVVIAIAALAAGLVYAYQHSEKFRTVVQKLGDVMQWLTGVIGDVLSWIKGHWKLLVVIIGGPIAAVALLVIKHWTAIKSFVTGAVTKIVGFVKDHWKLLIAIILGPLAAIVLLVISKWGAIKSATSNAWNAIKDLTRNAWNAVKDVIRGAWDGIRSIVSSGAGRLVSAVAAIPGRLTNLAGRFGSAGMAVINAFVNGMKNASGVVSGIAGNVWDAVKSLLNSAIGQINAALDFTISIPGPDIHVSAGNIPYLARGGIVTRPTLAVIGESGPEAVIPLGQRMNAVQTVSQGDIILGTLVVKTPDGKELQREMLKLKRHNGGLALGFD